MNLSALSPCIATRNIDDTRKFYVKYFQAKPIFDCGWYLNLQFTEGATLQFINPPDPNMPLCNTAGLTYNFLVSDVDAEHARLTSAGLQTVMPLEDHPWGDRGFAIQDPNGVILYFYSDREPSAEFKQYYTR